MGRGSRATRRSNIPAPRYSDSRSCRDSSRSRSSLDVEAEHPRPWQHSLRLGWHEPPSWLQHMYCSAPGAPRCVMEHETLGSQQFEPPGPADGWLQPGAMLPFSTQHPPSASVPP
jgi:hypothetical protein